MERVHIISKTKQEFLGSRYWLEGRYFARYGKRLHRVVWQYFHSHVCSQCGKKYQTRHLGRTKYCNQNCKIRTRRRRLLGLPENIDKKSLILRLKERKVLQAME